MPPIVAKFLGQQRPIPSIEHLHQAFDVMDATCWLKGPDGDYYPCGRGTAATFLYAIIKELPIAEGFGVKWTGNAIGE
jgi:hypothetical protein